MNSSAPDPVIDHSVVVGPFQCNCHILVCPRTGEAALVDPGDEAKKILSVLGGVRLPSGMPLAVKWLFHTHGHLDHIGGTRGVIEGLALAKGVDVPRIALHEADEPLYQNLKQQGQLFGMHYDEPLAITHRLCDGEEIQVGDLKFSVLHTPGHSPGSVGLRLHEDTSLSIAETVYTGDTLFQGSVGRTDLWGANQDQMLRSIRERLLVLDGDTKICPGHGDSSTIGVEKRSNPFLR